VLRLAWFGRRLAAERLRLIARRARRLKLLKLMQQNLVINIFRKLNMGARRISADDVLNEGGSA
jgi:hypothetical protein